MARRKETVNEFEPRHRILGAIVLVTLGFVVFSVLLSDQPRRLGINEKTVSASPDIRVVVTQIPTPDANASRPKIVHVTTKAVNNPLAPKNLTRTVAPVAPKEVKFVAPVSPRVVTKTTPTVTHKPATKKIAKLIIKKWMVQVGTFSDPANARRLRKKLQSQQYRVVTKTISLDSGTATRIRVGPYVSRQVATQARNRIDQKNGIKGVVLARK